MIVRDVILFKEEVTYNTDPTPTAGANAIKVRNPSWALEGLRMAERDEVVRNILGRDKPVHGGHLRAVSFEIELAGSGTAGTAPRFGDVLETCGFDETVVASTSVTYEPVSTGQKSGTLYYYEDGKLHKLTGCRGRITGNMAAGAPGVLPVVVIGHDAGESDVAVPSPTYDGVAPPAFLGASFSIGGYSATIGNFTFDLGNAIAMPPDVNAADGYGEVTITNRKASGNIDPAAVVVATQDFKAKLTGGTEMAVDTGVIGGTAGNRWRIQMPKVVYTGYEQQNTEAIRRYGMPFAILPSSGDDDISLTFT